VASYRGRVRAHSVRSRAARPQPLTQITVIPYGTRLDLLGCLS
jgi:hypothetical protein